MASWLDTALGYLQDNKSNIGLLTGIAGMTGLLDNFTGAKNTGPRGYQGSIPNYTATRSRVPSTYDPTRRPGSGGQRYFTDTQFVPKVEGEAPATPMSAEGLAALNLANPAQQRMPQTRTQEMASASAATPAPASGVATLNPVPTYTMASEFPAPVEETQTMSGGGEVVGQLMANPYFVGGGLGLGFLEAGRQSGISPLDNSKTFLGKERPYTPDYEGRKYNHS